MFSNREQWHFNQALLPIAAVYRTERDKDEKRDKYYHRSTVIIVTIHAVPSCFLERVRDICHI